MGLLDKIRGKDDEPDRKDRKAGTPGTGAPAGGTAPRAADRPRADFSDVTGASSTTEGGRAAAARTYTVVAGDSLSRIAQREYGDASKWKAIHAANRDKIPDPDLIHPGQVLTLPANP